jgi:hypothetical protein
MTMILATSLSTDGLHVLLDVSCQAPGHAFPIPIDARPAVNHARQEFA